MSFPRSRLWCLSVSLMFALMFVVGLKDQAEASSRETFVLGRNLDTTLLDEALKVSPGDLIPYIESLGVKVYLYPSRAKRNPDLAKGQKVSDELRAEPMLRHFFEDSGGGSTIADLGMFIPREDSDLGKYGTFIVLAESANAYTLLHEFTHFLFYSTELPGTRVEKYLLQEKAYRASRNLALQFEYGLRYFESSDVYKRENLLDLLIADLDIEGQRVHWFVAEEVIIESLLLARIRPATPYYQEKRVAAGRAYALGNIKGARVEVSRRMHLWDEVKQSFMRTAGAHPHTSHAEREEIVMSIPVYQAEVEKKAGLIESSLKLLETLFP
jgi:hypothetical protein